MTTSAIAVTEGSGKNIWTDQRSVASVNREAQYTLEADSAMPTYVVAASSVRLDVGVGSSLLQLMSGASTYTRVKYLRIDQAGNAGAATSLVLDVYRVTTAGTGGTAITPAPLDTADTASATGMHSIASATRGTHSTLLWRVRLPLGSAYADRWVYEWTPAVGGKPLIIPSGTGNGLSFTFANSIGTAVVDCQAHFTETAWL